MASKKIQLYTDRDKTIEASPETSANCVILSDGNDLQKVLDNDLTTPTVVHEETSFKVGVGDVNVSSSVVDGESSKVVIKGKTYQNILPEPSLRNSMTNGKSMQKLNEGYENVNVVDGVAKSAILKGNTLVNLNNGQRNETLDSTIGNGSSRTYACKIPYTIPSGTYITFKLKTNTINGITGNLKAHFKQNAATTTTGDRYPTLRNYNSHPTGEYYINVCHQTPIDLEAINLYIDDNVGVIDVSDVMILIGDYTNVDIPYFEGMQSVRMPVLKSIGKNLCKYRSDWVANGLTFTNTDSGVIVNGTASTIVDYYITTRTGSINVETLDVLNSLQVGTRVFLSNNLGKSSFMSYTLNGEMKYANNVIIQNGMQIVGAFIRFREGDICNNLNLTIQLEIGNEATSYEPYKSNILSTPQDLVLGGIGDVQDTLDLLTGEVELATVERGLSTLSNLNWSIFGSGTPNAYYTCVINDAKDGSKIISDSLVSTQIYTTNTKYGVYFSGNSIRLRNDEATSGMSVVDFKNSLSSSTNKIRYVLAEKVIKTVDLSSFGNWEKVVLDGSEEWTRSTANNNYFVETKISLLANRLVDVENNFCHNSNLLTTKVYTTNTNIGICLPLQGGVRIRTEEILKGQSIEEFKLQLSQNPITVWYPITTSQENSIKEVLSFANGHIQLSSEEGSLIPSLDYEVPTNNSYHMDLMKINTRHTMKAKTASGTFTIDGTSYGAGTNGTFTTPTSMTNKLLVMSNETNEEVMIIEGDVTDKTIPYFKGIKSAFEDESKIEVLSTGKNLFNMNGEYILPNKTATVVQNLNEITISSVENGTYVNAYFVLDKDFFKGKTVIGSCLYEYDMKGIGTVQINYQDVNGKRYYHSLKPQHRESFTFPNEIIGNILLCIYANNTGTPQSNTVRVKNIQLELGKKATSYEPYKSNNTKIPLLSPLRSLPNGVYDELIIDRMKKKAKIIQRVGEVVLDGSETWSAHNTWSAGDVACFHTTISDRKATSYAFSDRFKAGKYSELTSNSVAVDEGLRYDASSVVTYIFILKSRLLTPDISGFKKWLSQNPTTVYYELETPVITEVDLEGFPYIYKDGHIFLNSEIAPVVEIAYNINQSQQIQSNNETLQRHELDILDLDNLIVSFVNAEYNLRLLKFDMELSMMALAE